METLPFDRSGVKLAEAVKEEDKDDAKSEKRNEWPPETPDSSSSFAFHTYKDSNEGRNGKRRVIDR